MRMWRMGTWAFSDLDLDLDLDLMSTVIVVGVVDEGRDADECRVMVLTI